MTDRYLTLKAKRRISVMLIAAFMLAAWVMASDCVFAVRGQEDAAGSDAHNGCRSKTFDLLTPEDIPSDGAVGGQTGSRKARRAAPTDSGSYIPLVMIVMGFDEQPYNEEYNWSETIFEGDGSIEKYYRDMSSGKFTFMPAAETCEFGAGGNVNTADTVNDGIIHVTLDRKKTLGWVTDGSGEENDLEMMQSFAEALELAGEYIDFGSYDSNGDGEIQTSELAVGFVVSGLDAAKDRGRDEKHIWPHAYSFSDFSDCDTNMPEPPVIRGAAVNSYIAIAESYISGSAIKQSYLGTLAHELGHYLGLPDLYDTANGTGDWKAYGVKYLSLMDYGNYGEDPDGNIVPYSLDIWSRVRLGWVDPVNIQAGDVKDIAGSLSGDPFPDGEASEAVPEAYRIDTGTEGEYYLLENRRFAGWDAGMGKFFADAVCKDGSCGDGGGGLLIWHIDDNTIEKYLYTGEVNNKTHHPGVMPLFRERDGGRTTLIGTSLILSGTFFDSTSWEGDMFLPLYGTVDNDKPADRTTSMETVLSLESPSLPVMQFHMHDYSEPGSVWAEDKSKCSVTIGCPACGRYIATE
ncbi:MAG: M6 family metalloprotease domain-containing protein, partial [Clostridiales bacterium]|nr:M6 family metalloprotease domain-containing protein [Clostridiales bacterium]